MTAALPRLVTLMGSGELAPTMVKVHRSLLGRLGPPPVPALLLDTPFGFQENAGELAAKAVRYFAESLRTKLEVASLDRPAAGEPDTGVLAEEELALQLRRARYVFSGPGSPSYALRRWRGTVVPQLLADKLAHGGAVTFASAAALTLGAYTVPVYEVYKVGEDPHWLEGLDVLKVAGLKVAVIPHFNNAEGGTHDTRFCYLGERRLRCMEEQLPPDCFVLGIDEHTALACDLDARLATIEGLGLVTVRHAGRSTTFEPGVVPLDALAEAAFVGRSRRPRERAATAEREEAAAGSLAAAPIARIAHDQEQAFDAALGRADARGAVEAVLELERRLGEWATDIPQGDELDRARASLRAMVVELGRLAEPGVRGPVEILRPFVELLLAVREEARAAGDFGTADRIRERMARLGVEVRDTPHGPQWLLRAQRDQEGSGPTRW